MTEGLGSIQGFPAVNTFQYNPNPYGFDDIDCDLSTYPIGMAGMGMGMGGSIFGPMPMLGGMGSPQNYFDNMKAYQQFNIDYNVDQQKLQRNADLRINASMEAITNSVAALRNKIIENEQDQIEDAYRKFVNTVGTAYGRGTREEITARAQTIYAQMTGSTIVDDLRQHGHGSATQGFIQTLTFGTYDRKSAEDNISTITGTPVGTGEKTKHNLGRLAGAATIGGIAGGIAKACKKGKAGMIGLVVGGAAALLSFITGKVTT